MAAKTLYFVKRLTAITTHANATQGDKRSPIRAHFQKRPGNPSLLESMSRGITPRMYVHVHIRSRRTKRRDWKLNSADIYAYFNGFDVYLGCRGSFWIEVCLWSCSTLRKRLPSEAGAENTEHFASLSTCPIINSKFPSHETDQSHFFLAAAETFTREVSAKQTGQIRLQK